jgi:tyrosine-protein phosphatase YwqE
MFNLFRKACKEPLVNFSTIKVDIHSHILPGIDDGPATLQESIALVRNLKDLGFLKLIATPHIMADLYPNTKASIEQALFSLQSEINNQGLKIKIEAAAEYFFDETFEYRIDTDQLLTIGDGYLLFELSYINQPNHLPEVLKKLIQKGYKPILAHPERYLYLHQSLDNFKRIKDYGCYFQLNTISLTGYYNKQIQKVAEYLVDQNLVDFIGSDVHKTKQAEALEKVLINPYFEKLIAHKSLLNQALN